MAEKDVTVPVVQQSKKLIDHDAQDLNRLLQLNGQTEARWLVSHLAAELLNYLHNLLVKLWVVAVLLEDIFSSENELKRVYLFKVLKFGERTDH